MSIKRTEKNEKPWIDVEGFKVHIEELNKKQIIPEYFNSPLVALWEITRTCNLRCIHCYNRSGKKLPNELFPHEKISIAKQIVDAKVFRMCLSGGEPILCESFWEIAKILKQGHVLCNTITNGAFVDENNAEKYAKYFYAIQVSIDGANPKTHDRFRGKKGSWKKAINACKLLVENKGLVAVATTVSPFNVYDLDKLIDLSYNIGASEIRMDFISFVGQAAINHDNLALTREQFKIFEKIVAKKKKEYGDKKISFYIPEYTLKDYSISLSKLPLFFLYISPSGTCAPSSVIPFSGDSLKKKSLKEIWDKLKTCHNHPEFIKYSRILKTREDFIKLDEIPYVKGELHDK